MDQILADDARILATRNHVGERSFRSRPAAATSGFLQLRRPSASRRARTRV